MVDLDRFTAAKKAARNERKREYNRRYREAHSGPVICENESCGKVFHGGMNAHYCPDCRFIMGVRKRTKAKELDGGDIHDGCKRISEASQAV